MADVDPTNLPSKGSQGAARTELKITTGPIRGSRKVHVGPLKVAMREIDLAPSSGEPPLRVYDTSEMEYVVRRLDLGDTICPG